MLKGRGNKEERQIKKMWKESGKRNAINSRKEGRKTDAKRRKT